MARKTAVIIGAGPAGLTAAWELLDRTDITPIVFEASGELGGISRTVNYKGNRIDIGGHRFFSKSDRVMNWWLNIMPLQGAPARDDLALKREVPLAVEARNRALRAPAAVVGPAPDPERTDRVMLHRGRVSRIFFQRKFFKYPITLEPQTLRNLGLVRVTKMGVSYVLNRLRPARKELSLEDFFINRFGPELYRTFFRDYTEKVWGVPCREIKPEWGAQRIKGLSVTGAILHALRKPFRRSSGLAQKNVETSLIDQFMYPKHGPGQMWEEVAAQVLAGGGEIHLRQAVVGMTTRDGRVGQRHRARRAERHRARHRGRHLLLHDGGEGPGREHGRRGAAGRARGRRRSGLPRFHHRGPAAAQDEDPQRDRRCRRSTTSSRTTGSTSRRTT